MNEEIAPSLKPGETAYICSELPDTAKEIHEVAIAERKINRNTLYHIAMDLQELLDMEEFPDEDHWAQFTADLAERGSKQVAKVQDVGTFYLSLKQTEENCDVEIKRIQDFKAHCKRVRSRMDASIEYVIKAVGKDVKGKWKKLMGRTVSLGLRNNPGKVKVDDMDALPPRYKRHGITVWGDTWAQVIACLPDELRLRLLQEINERKFDTEYSATRIKEDMLEKGLDIPGADIEYTQSVTVK